jgi:hypothetical protein
VSLEGGQYALYVGDQWQVTERFAITGGIRGDLLDLSGHAPYNGTVDSIFGRRTDEMPPPPFQVSPRLGFNWNLAGSGRDRLRGGIGMFSVRPPIAWLHAPRYLYGSGIGTLHCGIAATDIGPPPAFTPDYRAPPLSCANGSTITMAARKSVDLLDPHLHLAQTLRASLGYDRDLPWDLTASIEGVVTRSRNDFAFVNLNLSGPQAVDVHGRVLYGTVDTRPALDVRRSDRSPKRVGQSRRPAFRASRKASR